MSNNYQANLITPTTVLSTAVQYIENSLDSVFTGNSGTSAPTYVQPYNTWVNTNTNIQYYIESGSNNSIIMNNMSSDNVKVITTDTVLNVGNHEQYILTDASSGAVTVTLSTLSNVSDTGYTATIKKVDATSNNVIIAYSDIDGMTSIVLQDENDSIVVVYHSNKYYVVSSNIKPVLVNKEETGASYDVVPGDNNDVILINNGVASSINLPASASVANGFNVILKKVSGASLDVTILPDGADLIDGAASYVLNTQYEYLRLTTDSTGAWHIISKG